jgi:drug/metabolite transporter (DMT)-like permease
MRTALLTGLALVAFAMNSVLCRLALGAEAIDAASFSTIRLASGAGALLLITFISQRRLLSASRADWISALLLFLYAVAFSLAYVGLSTGTGALLLFGSVQATMLIAALRAGERLSTQGWAGLLLALAGLVYLVFPGLAAPPPVRSALMAVAGVSWGFYSLRGRRASDPVLDTTNNFLRALPLALLVSIFMSGSLHVSAKGSLLAVLSGALASGVGYVIWYAALKGLTAVRAATVQLTVPVLAATCGVLFLSEKLSARLLLSALMILGGVGLALASRTRLKIQAETKKKSPASGG